LVKANLAFRKANLAFQKASKGIAKGNAVKISGKQIGNFFGRIMILSVRK
jgi:hypothetical protein